MNPTLARDLGQLPALLDATAREAASVLAGLDTRPAAIAPAPFDPVPLADGGHGALAALETFNTRFAGGFSGSAGPRYLGFVTGGATPAALVGDWLTASWDQNPTASLDTSAPDLERETVARLATLFGLPDTLRGTFVTGATMSNFAGLAIAREWLGEQRGISVADAGLAALGPVRILSGTPHSSILKAASMLGLGRQSVETLPCLPGREAVDIPALEARLAALDGEPCIVVGNAGTVNTVDFDDLAAIAALRSRYPFWLHVDAAFGAFAAVSPPHAHLVHGLGLADSLCIDLHKWLNVPYDAAIQLSHRQDLQLRVFRNSAAYLGLPGAVPDFVHLTPENSRRLRAMASWFTLEAYGRQGVRETVMENCRLAAELGRRLAEDPAFELLAPVRMNVVCFTLQDLAAGPDGETAIQTFVRRVRDSGEVFVTPTVLHGRWGVRAAFSNWRTGDADLPRILAALQAAAA